MMTKISLIRHGETAYNMDKNALLQRDVPLTPFGCLQSSLLTGDYDVLIVSPLRRTRMTYGLSRITCHTAVRYDQRVREYRTCPCDFYKDEDIIYETESQITERCQEVYNDLKINCPGKRIGIITHANWIQYFTKVIGAPILHTIDNCGVVRHEVTS